MKHRLSIFAAAATATMAAVLLPPATAFAQERAEAAEAIPRTSTGHADLNGTWDNGSGIDFLNPQQVGDSICVFACEEADPPARSASAAAPPAPDRPRYKPEFLAKVRDLDARQVEEDPVLRCFNPGLPRIGPPDKIVQIPGQIVFLYDDVNGSYFRIIPTDGRGHRTDVEASRLGDAIGYWDGDTLVVESVNFTDDTWLTDDGSFHTAHLRVVERLSRIGDTLHWQATAHDPAVLAEPWQKQPRTATLTDIELVEAPPCLERDLPLMQDLSSHDNPR